MNIYGLLAVIISCITLVGIILMMLLKPFHFIITHITKDITPPPPEPEKPSMGFKTDKTAKKLEEEINETQISSASMDAVIQAANELMGIETVDRDKGDKK